jgi:hypothetical protein
VGSKKLKKVQLDSKLYRAAAENFKLGDSLEANNLEADRKCNRFRFFSTASILF